MTTLYRAHWVLPVSSPAVADGVVAVEDDHVVAVGTHDVVQKIFPAAEVRSFGEAAIIPGLINSHSHLELTAMRGFLDPEEGDFFAWLKKLTIARREQLTSDDLYVSAAWGACEAARAGVTSLADASASAAETLAALRDVGLRGTVFQESFGPDPRLARENFEKLKSQIACLREMETRLVGIGVSPHAPYTVCGAQLELIAAFALTERLPIMMHAAESASEELFMIAGSGPFADGLRGRGIDWSAPGISTVDYLSRLGVLQTRPLLAHCIRVNQRDMEVIQESGTRIAHCPKSNAKLGHGLAPFGTFLNRGIAVGLGSDSVASNNTCDLLAEAQYAVLFSRAFATSSQRRILQAEDGLRAATLGGARALGLEGRVGELREGLQADFCVVSLAHSQQIPSYDPLNTLIFASSGSDIMLTVVAGKEVYREGRVTTVDEERLRARMKEIGQRLAAWTFAS